MILSGELCEIILTDWAIVSHPLISVMPGQGVYIQVYMYV